MTTLPVASDQPSVRPATAADLPAIVALLAEDRLGRSREDASLPLDQAYLAGFAAITGSPDVELLVLEHHGSVIGCLQLTFIPGLSFKGAWRADVEGVRVLEGRRGSGLGRLLMKAAVARARARGCSMVQLTTHRSRAEAQRFYAGLGFVASHTGMKLMLDDGVVPPPSDPVRASGTP